MTTEASTVPAFLDALKAALEARAGLAGVQVSTGPLGADTKGESIQVLDVEHSEEWGALGARRRDESYIVTLGIWSLKPGTEANGAMKEARDRVYAIAAEIADELRANPHTGGERVTVAAFGGMGLDQGANDAARWAQLDVGIRVDAQLRYTA